MHKIDYFVNFVVFSLIFCTKLSDGQVLQFGLCTEVKTMEYFDLVRFLGQWYEIERFPAWYENYGRCAYKRFQYCGRRVEIEHVFIRDEIQYVLHLNSTYAPGDEAVFVIKQNNVDPVGIPLTVISTDYTNYAVVYGCQCNPTFGLKYISAWILAREKHLSEDILKQAYQELNSIPYASVAYLEKVEQNDENCMYHWTAHVQAVTYENDEDDDEE